MTPVPSDPEAVARASRRRLAVVQLLLGPPAVLVVVIGLVLGFRLAGRPLGAAFWWALGPVLGVFAVYLGRAAVVYRRTSRPPGRDGGRGEGSPE